MADTSAATLDGRIIKGVGGLYTVATAKGHYACTMRGIFRKRGLKPAIGDFVIIGNLNDALMEASVSDIKPRKNSLERPWIANIDQVVVVFSVKNPALNEDLLDRFLLTADYRGINPVLCLSKTDLAPEPAALRDFCELYRRAGYPVLKTCAKTGDGIGELKSLLCGLVSAFAGPSGVGKSSLINCLLGQERMETGELSKKVGRGKHTTRHAELLELPGMRAKSYVVDSPGFTALDTDMLEPEALPELFREFRPYLNGCRFNDCRHLMEPDCLVKAHVGDTIHEKRYNRYKEMMEKGRR